MPGKADPSSLSESLELENGASSTLADLPEQAPCAAVAAKLFMALADAKGALVYLASSERRAEAIGRALSGMGANSDAVVLPPWDCLPYDRASPAADVMGRRLSILGRLSVAKPPRALILSPAALIQRLPPKRVFQQNLTLEEGRAIDRSRLSDFTSRSGYVLSDRVDEPSEIAFMGEVIDVFPADGDAPVRVLVDSDDVAKELRLYDPITQRTGETVPSVTLGPASEVILEADGDGRVRHVGIEHQMPSLYGPLKSLFDLVPDAQFSEDLDFRARLEDFQGQIIEAYDNYCSLGAVGEALGSKPEALYLTAPELIEPLKTWRRRELDFSGIEAIAGMAVAPNPGKAFCTFVQSQCAAGQKVIIAGTRKERRGMARALERGLRLKLTEIADWTAATALEAGAVAGLELEVETGFSDAAAGLTVIAAPDVLGDRLADTKASSLSSLTNEPDLRPGDVVLHEDHGVGVLRELVRVDVDGVTQDALRLEYQGGASILAPVDELGRVWRYGAEQSAITLDRLNGEGWPKRRAEVSRHLDEAAERLIALAEARQSAVCAPASPPKAAFARFAARFGYHETPDQRRAIDAVLADLRSGRPMDRLVCGDVGFGKTEVALRAAAAVALCGRQVAVCAPTTVLAKQHFQTFVRRFAGTGLKVEQLSRLVAPAEMKVARQSISSGDAAVVIGTHALVSDQVKFADLGLMIIDEEQKFGAAVKRRLREMAGGGHILSMTATPIPRTLQGAMVGIQEISVITTPPSRRRPIRTFIAPFDPASMRTALLREKRRGGQSFVVVPRIADLKDLGERLKSLVPELIVSIAHGDLPVDEVDAAMVAFAEGKGDVLLATNIIESGLDVPRANTMLIWRPDRFGLAQLHQLRGRVGRGRSQGIAYLLHDPAETLSDAVRARLSTLEAFDRLGSGLDISVRDLDLRGGGDLTGDDQAGHMQMVGAALYHHLLDRAMRIAKGEMRDQSAMAILRSDEGGSIPVDYVPDAVTRINLYARLARLQTVEAIDAFQEELDDRFGPAPETVGRLLTHARLLALAQAAGVLEVSVGPKATALTMVDGGTEAQVEMVKEHSPRAVLKAGRLILPTPEAAGEPAGVVLEKVLVALGSH